MIFAVRTQDTDGSSYRKYKTRTAAFKRFEEMLGYTVEAAISEQYHAAAVPPTRESVTRLRAVSMFGTVVSFVSSENQ